MIKKFLVLAFALAIPLAVLAIDDVVRFQGQTLNQGGTSSTSGKAVVESDSVTNAFRIVVVTASVTGAETTSTNTFSTAFVSTPSIISAYKSGSTHSGAGLNQVTPTVTTANLLVAGMNSAGSTNALTFVIYGPVRTGRLN